MSATKRKKVKKVTKTKKRAKPDIYAREVARLRKNPELILETWNPDWNLPGPLFGFITPDRKTKCNGMDGKIAGCLTTIRNDSDFCVAVTAKNTVDEKLTKQIAADRKLPKKPELITAENLPRFAFWQRKLDKHYKRKPPTD